MTSYNLYAKYSDKQLFDELSNPKRNVSEAAFTELYERYSSEVYAYCVQILKDSHQAKDAFQETFLRLYRGSESQRHVENVASFIFKIARNLCLNQKRDRKVTFPFQEYDIPITHFISKYEEAELLQLVAMASELLDDEHREAFILREYNGLSYQEIAQVVGDSDVTIRSRVSRAKQKIRHILQPYLNDINRNA